MSEYPTITRIRPISTSSVGSERALRLDPLRPDPNANHVSTENGVSAVVALGSLIVGLGVTGVPQRRI